MTRSHTAWEQLTADRERSHQSTMRYDQAPLSSASLRRKASSYSSGWISNGPHYSVSAAFNSTKLIPPCGDRTCNRTPRDRLALSRLFWAADTLATRC